VVFQWELHGARLSCSLWGQEGHELPPLSLEVLTAGVRELHTEELVCDFHTSDGDFIAVTHSA